MVTVGGSGSEGGGSGRLAACIIVVRACVCERMMRVRVRVRVAGPLVQARGVDSGHLDLQHPQVQSQGRAARKTPAPRGGAIAGGKQPTPVLGPHDKKLRGRSHRLEAKRFAGG